MPAAFQLKRWGLGVTALVVLTALVVAFMRSAPAPSQPEPEPEPEGNTRRIVSLSPALTETLFSIGAGDQVVGVSDYCNFPPAATSRTKAGTSITPNYEKIVSLAPTVIVTEAVVNSRPERLSELANTQALPWLSLDDVVSGTRRLGAIAGRRQAAEALATKLETRLRTPAPGSAPRVLLVLGYGGPRLGEVWFIRRNSLHGAALRAAGGRNAVARDISGQPRLSLEKVLSLDPDVILVLLADGGTDAASVKASWQKLEPLRAVKQQKLGIIRAPEAFVNGPRILELVDRMAAELGALLKRQTGCLSGQIEDGSTYRAASVARVPPKRSPTCSVL
jgi:iron complex transport system substrate-binding protein